MEKLVRNVLVASFLKEKLDSITEKTTNGAFTRYGEYITNLEIEIIEDYIKEFGLKI